MIVSCYGARRERRIVLRKTKAEDASESIGGEEEEGEGKKKIVKAKSYAWVSLPSLFKPQATWEWEEGIYSNNAPI